MVTAMVFVGCQTAEPTQETISSVNNVESTDITKHTAEDDTDPEEDFDLNQPSWEIVTAAFPIIDSFPIQPTVFPLQPIIVYGDTLKIDGDIYYHFPKQIAIDFIQDHVEASDTLAIWLEENESLLGKGTDFEFGIYPQGTFEHNGNTYYLFNTLDYLTGRGSYNLSFYLATATNQKWNTVYLGEKSYSKYNTYEMVEGESFVKDRMASERNFSIQRQADTLVITHFLGDHEVGDNFNPFLEENIDTTTVFILE